MDGSEIDAGTIRQTADQVDRVEMALRAKDTLDLEQEKNPLTGRRALSLIAVELLSCLPDDGMAAQLVASSSSLVAYIIQR